MNPILVSKQSEARKVVQSLPDPVFKYGLDIQSSPAQWDFALLQKQKELSRSFTHWSESPSGVIVCDFDYAAKKFPTLLEKMGSLMKRDQKLEMHHLSNVEKGLLVYVPPHVRTESPILLPPLDLVYSHIVVVAESHSAVTLIQTESHSLSSTFQSSVTEVFASPYSHVSIVSQQTLPSTLFRVAIKRGIAAEHAAVDWFWVEHGSAFTKLDVSAELSGELASSQNVGVAAGSDTQAFDLSQVAVHQLPSTKSTLLARGVLNDSAKCVYHGLLKMVKEAKGSVGSQRADFLLLSPQSEADPVPALEIEGADVRCTHAATVGRLDKEKLFYLSSRGLPEEVARSLYIQGFLEHVLSFFPLHDSMNTVRSCLAQSLDLSPHVDSHLVKEDLVHE